MLRHLEDILNRGRGCPGRWRWEVGIGGHLGARDGWFRGIGAVGPDGGGSLGGSGLGGLVVANEGVASRLVVVVFEGGDGA